MILLHVATNVLWISPLLIQTVIVGSMIRRRLVRVFPLFFSYTASTLLVDASLMFVRYASPLYASIYWWGDAVVILLGVASIFETIKSILASYPNLRVVFSIIWIVAGVAAFASLLLMVFSGTPGGTDRMLHVIFGAERSARLFQVLILVVLMALMSRLGLTWNQQSVGIVTGFGVYSALALSIFEFQVHSTVLTTSIAAIANSAAYNIAVVIWACYLVFPRTEAVVTNLPKENLSEWNAAVTEYVHQWQRPF